MRELLRFMRLFEEFRAVSWLAWRDVLARLTPEIREFYAIAGRGSGKSRISALLACWFASREYSRKPGEQIFVGIFAPDRKQARVTLRYVIGMLKSVPALAALIKAETRDGLELHNGVVIEVLTASRAAPRGRAYALAVIEEAAFLPNTDAADPDVELLRALRPALARVSGSLLCVITSPYSREGIVFEAAERYAVDPDPETLLIQEATLTLNPTFDAKAIDRAFRDDPTSAETEYSAVFRRDVEKLLSREAIAAVTIPGRLELPPVAGTRYLAFVDPSGGSADSMTLAVAHVEKRSGQSMRVLDAVREFRPPFSPDDVVNQCAQVLHNYRVTFVTGDRYAGEWAREPFRRQHGLEYRVCERVKSDLYRDSVPLINSAVVELLDLPVLRNQLIGLERRTGRSGKDIIDHKPNSHDDVANSALGAIAELVKGRGAVFGVMHFAGI